MDILTEAAVHHKPGVEPGQPPVQRARAAIKRFARGQAEYLRISQQFESDLDDCAGDPVAQHRVCSAYLWLAKGL